MTDCLIGDILWIIFATLGNIPNCTVMISIIPDTIMVKGPSNEIYNNASVSLSFVTWVLESSKIKLEVMLSDPRKTPSIRLSHFLEYGCSRQCVIVRTVIDVLNSW